MTPIGSQTTISVYFANSTALASYAPGTKSSAAPQTLDTSSGQKLAAGSSPANAIEAAIAASANKTALPTQQLQNASQAVKTLGQQGSSASDGAKGAAMQKLDALKAQLKALMMLGGDPKERALEAAAIAKEIAAAARAYAQAGGDPGSLAVPAPETTIEESPTSDAQAGSESFVPGTATPDLSPGPMMSPPITDASTDANTSPSTTPTGTGASVGLLADAGAAGNQIKSSTTTNDSSANAALSAAKAGSSAMDRAFFQEALRLAHQAKAIILSAEQRLSLQHAALDPAVVHAADAAVAAVASAANQVGASQTGDYNGSIPESSAPAVSLTA